MQILNTITEYTGPDSEWTEKEQEEECCTHPIPHDECIEDGRKEPYDAAEKADLDFELEKRRIKHEKAGRRIMNVVLEDTGPVGPCGEKITKWEDRNNCCDQPAPVFKFTLVPPASLEWNNIYNICVTGGYPPYTWSVEGRGLTIGDMGSCAKIAVNDCFCDTGKIICTDICDQVIEYVVSTDHECAEEMVYDHASSSPIVYDNSQGYIYWDNGMPPFTVSISGQNFFLNTERTESTTVVQDRRATIYATDACGTAEITIRDKCGETISGSVRSENGEWVQTYYADGGILGGDPDGPYGAPREGGCPFELEFPYTEQNLTQDYTIGGWRVYQFYNTQYPQGGNFDSQEEAAAWCQYAKGTPLANSIVFPWRLVGNCNTYGFRCMECECIRDPYHDIRDSRSLDPGFHGQIERESAYYNTPWRVRYSWSVVVLTRIYEWRC